MFYTSNQSNNEYYSSYKKNMQENPEKNSIKKFIKLGLIILFFAFLSVAIVYLVNYFSTETEEPLFSSSNVKTNIILTEKELLEEDTDFERIELTDEALPQSIQLQKSNSQKIEQIQLNATDTFAKENLIQKQVSKTSQTANINPKDIALIVEIIMAQMNNSPEPTLEEQLVNAQEQTMIKQNLKDMNHYNKVVVNTNNQKENPSELMQLQNNLNTIMDESIEKNTSSSYSKAITKEISVRSNEMRIIVVQKGDTLSKIAEKAYGRKKDYLKIFTANPEIIKNPDEIFVGQKLRIPS